MPAVDTKSFSTAVANCREAYPMTAGFLACLPLRRRANQWLITSLLVSRRFLMSDQSSELVEISKLNGDFKRNYGKLIGAFLYLRSVSAARGRSWFWAGVVSFSCTAALAWLARHGWMISLSP